MPETKSIQAFGFLSVVTTEPFGHTGGYLLLNMSGRPLEFHCTAPVKPNRAQEILYGPTLLPYLFGEQIGRTLFRRGGVEPLALFTNIPAMLAIGEFLSTPLVLVNDSSEPGGIPALSSDPTTRWRVDQGASGSATLERFHWHATELAMPATAHGERQRLLDRLPQSSIHDLAEPFGRIRDAIAEAHRGRGVENRAVENRTVENRTADA